MDVLRARAFLDLVLSKDSRPGAEPTAKPSPGGFAGRATLTVPLATLLDLADRPGEIPGIGPIDPNPGAIHPIVTGPRNEPTQRERLIRRARTCRTPYPWAEMPGAQQTGWCWE